MANKKEYVSKAKTTSIRFTSRASLKVNDSYYTVEATEERMIPDLENIDLTKEKELLWDSVNADIDGQIEDILETYKK